MSMEIRLPNITANTDAGQLQQVKSYLYQMAQELNWALNSLESGSTRNSTLVNAKGQPIAITEKQKSDPVSNFNEIKALIIKSADIVNAYYTEINKRLEGLYVTESDFGAFKEETSAEFTASSQRVDLVFSNLQSITSDLAEVQQQNIDIRAYIRYGLLYVDAESGESIYGLELGQDTEKNGETVFARFVRLTANKLSFYDENGIEVAYASGERFCCPSLDAEKLYLGGFQFFPRTNGNLSIRWVGD